MPYRAPKVWEPQYSQLLAVIALGLTTTAVLLAVLWHKADWLAAAGQVMSVVVACAALSVAVWAVKITESVAEEIRTSGRNSDLIAASSNIQQQWQLINGMVLERPELMKSWEPEGEAGREEHFPARLALCFYILQILKQTRLYQNDDGIPLPDQSHSTLYWSHRLTTDFGDVWQWIKEKDRGFSPEIIGCVETWAQRYQPPNGA